MFYTDRLQLPNTFLIEKTSKKHFAISIIISIASNVFRLRYAFLGRVILLLNVIIMLDNCDPSDARHASCKTLVLINNDEFFVRIWCI